MKIKKINIEGLWQKYNLCWNLEGPVNILTGSNGSGKSTIFDIVAGILNGGRLDKSLFPKVSKVIIELEDNYKVTNINFNDSYLKLKTEADKDYVLKELEEDVTDDIGRGTQTKSRKSRLNSLIIQASISSVEHNKERCSMNNFLKQIDIDIISTFDTTLPDEDDSSRFPMLIKEGVRSNLDIELHELQEQYSYYLGGLANRMEKAILKGNEIDKNFITELYSQKNLFISIINELFKETYKTINTDKSKLEFILSDGKHLSMYELSSGEKQVLYILLKILLQEQKEYIVFMDEPEISLHIDWQEILINKILLLNPNCQLLIATHAPSLIIKGWDDSVKNINDLKC